MLLTKRVNSTYDVSDQDDGCQYREELLYLLLPKPNAVHTVYHHIEGCSMVEGRRGKERKGREGGREGGRGKGGREGEAGREEGRKWKQVKQQSWLLS